MFHYPFWAVRSCNSGPPAARTVGIHSTGGFYNPDLSPCTHYSLYIVELHVLTIPPPSTSVHCPFLSPSLFLLLLVPILPNKSVHYSRRERRRGFRGCPVICPRRGCFVGEFLWLGRLVSLTFQSVNVKHTEVYFIR